MLFGRKKDDTDRDDGTEAPEHTGGSIAVAEPPPMPKKDKRNKKDDDELEYEWELETPFGKIEFELEPAERKEQKERARREKAERDAAKQAAKLAKKAENAAKKQGATAGELVVVKRSNLVPALVIFALVIGAIALAYWLFSRPGDEEEDVVPEEFRAADAPVAAAGPQGLAARVKKAIREGRRASRDAQREQQQKFEEATKQP